jgi:hypothetical protein
MKQLLIVPLLAALTAAHAVASMTPSDNERADTIFRRTASTAVRLTCALDGSSDRVTLVVDLARSQVDGLPAELTEGAVVWKTGNSRFRINRITGAYGLFLAGDFNDVGTCSRSDGRIV